MPSIRFHRLLIHVDDITEIFQRVLMPDEPKYDLYNLGGTTISMDDLAEMVRGYLPDADIQFEKESGGKDDPGVYLLDIAPCRQLRRTTPPLTGTRAANY